MKTSIKSPLRYVGGKGAIADHLISRMPPLESVLEYREPFLGGGSVFLKLRDQLPNCARWWVNDALPELVAFWHIAQVDRKREILKRLLTNVHKSLKTVEDRRAFYMAIRDRECLPLDYNKRQLWLFEAFRFFYINRVSFSGTTWSGGFSPDAAMHRFTQTSIDRIDNLAGMLTHTSISNVDYSVLIDCPGSGVLLFLDPPYSNVKKYYGKKGDLHLGFDHERLCKLLKSTEHRFLLTYDNSPKIRDLYSWARLEPINLKYGMTSGNGVLKNGEELIITNF